MLADDNIDAFDATETMAASLQAPLGANNITEAGELIRWGRGMDVDAAPGDPNTAARPWITGDSIHSRPFALNYGDTDGAGNDFDPNNPDIKILFGTGNGSFHVIENIESAGVESGREVFAYYPRETLVQLKRRRVTGDGAKIDAGTDMRYGVDGEPVVLTVDANGDQSLTPDGVAADGSKDEAFVFFGLRRGGFSYHALDIINPSAPKLQWKITHTRDAGSSDFDELGLTFSTPRVTKVGYGGKIVDALVFAGGYYGGWDPNDPGASSQIGKDDPTAGADEWGNAVFIVNARSGELIWKATGRDGDADATVTNMVASTTTYVHKDMDHSIPSDVTVLENDAGVLHRIYVGDTGGNVWRVDTPSAPCDTCTVDQRENWFASRLADLSAGSDIRFFHAPDVVEVEDQDGNAFDGVLIQGGNRADPLDKRFSAVQNYLYYLRDYNVISGADGVIKEGPPGTELPWYTATDLIDRTECIDEDSAGCTSLVNNFGWKIKLGSPGEKGLSTPLVDFGRIFSSSYLPVSGGGACGESPEGIGKLYVTSLADGTAVGNQRAYELGPGIPPSPVIIGNAIWLPGGGVDADLDGDGETDDLLTKSFTQRLIPIYWREPGIDDL
jgi:type IV pilus assembly protein PilY1